MRFSLPTSLLALTVLTANAAAELTQVFVPGDFATIQEGLDNVANNQELVISGGTYPEAVTVTGKSFVNITCKGKVVIAPTTVNGIGLTLDSCDHFFIQNLRVQGSGVGIHVLNCDSLTFFRGGVEGTAGDGILIEGGGQNTLEKLTIKNVGGDCVDMAVGNLNTTDNNSCFVCKFIHPGVDGVGINGSNNHVDGCTITAAQRDGVSITPTSGGNTNTIKDTRIGNVVRHAILIKANGTHVDGCKISAPGGNGLDFESGTGGFVQDCKFSKCRDNGALLNGNGLTLETSKISKSTHDGVLANGDALIVQDCTVLGSGSSGYDIHGTNGAYTGDLAGRSKVDGFVLDGMGNTLSTCTGKSSKGFDLDNPAPLNNTLGDGNSFKTQGP
jgi:hypothetical protein